MYRNITKEECFKEIRHCKSFWSRYHSQSNYSNQPIYSTSKYATESGREIAPPHINS